MISIMNKFKNRDSKLSDRGKYLLRILYFSWVWWYIPVILELRRLRWGRRITKSLNLAYTVSSRQAWAKKVRPCLNNNKHIQRKHCGCMWKFTYKNVFSLLSTAVSLVLISNINDAAYKDMYWQVSLLIISPSHPSCWQPLLLIFWVTS